MNVWACLRRDVPHGSSTQVVVYRYHSTLRYAPDGPGVAPIARIEH